MSARFSDARYHAVLTAYLRNPENLESLLQTMRAVDPQMVAELEKDGARAAHRRTKGFVVKHFSDRNADHEEIAAEPAQSQEDSHPERDENLNEDDAKAVKDGYIRMSKIFDKFLDLRNHVSSPRLKSPDTTEEREMLHDELAASLQQHVDDMKNAYKPPDLAFNPFGEEGVSTKARPARKVRNTYCSEPSKYSYSPNKKEPGNYRPIGDIGDKLPPRHAQMAGKHWRIINNN